MYNFINDKSGNMKTNIVNLTPRFSVPQIIVFYYLIAVSVSTIFLLLPITQKPNAELTFIDAVFVAISAVTVTGLSTIDVSQLLSVPGTFIFVVILQFGGIGIMAFGTLLWLLLGRKIGIKERILITTEHNRLSFSGIVRLIRMLLFFFVVIELIGSVVLGTYFLKFFPARQDAYLQGFFASISAITNAGFDITGKAIFYVGD